MSSKFFVLRLHICVFDSVRVFFPVAFRKLVFCFVSNHLELASLFAYDCKLCQGSVNCNALEAKRKENWHLLVVCMIDGVLC